MVKKLLFYWREKIKLSARFHEAIDRADMRAGKGGSDAYLSEWRRESAGG